MAIKYGFFNSVDNDRVYGCDSFNEWLSPLASDGVYAANNSQALQVYAGTGLQVAVRAGEGRFSSYWFKSDAVETLSIETADVSLPRIDRIVVRVSESLRTITLAVVKGSVGSTPTPPALTRTSTVYEYSLAQVRVNANATSISQSNITDERLNANVCGIVTGLINQIDTSTLALQFETDLQEKITEFETEATSAIDGLESFISTKEGVFDTWFESVREQVQSTTILVKYTSNYTTIAANESSIPINIAQYNPLFDYLLVYVNGIKLIQSVEYTLTSSTVELTTPLETIGTVVSIDCYQSNNP